jgi:hypothetical protein
MVPRECGRKVLRTRTGIFKCAMGMSVRGWSTLAPNHDKRAASE